MKEKTMASVTLLVALWLPDTGTMRITDTRMIVSLAFSPDSKLLWVGSNRLEAYDVRTKKRTQQTRFGDDEVTSIAFQGQELLVATLGRSTEEKVGDPGRVMVLDQRLSTKRQCPGHHVALPHKDGFIAVEGEQGVNGRVIFVKDRESEVLLDDLPGFVCGLCTSSDLLAVGTVGRKVCLLDLKTRKVAELAIEFRGSNNCLTFMGDRLVMIDRSGSLTMWSSAGACLNTFPTQGRCLAANSTMVVIGMMTGSLEIYDKDGLKKSLKVHRSPVCAIAISPDGKLVASGSIDGDIVFTDLRQ
jgi:WD40 repeat protein